MYDAKFASGTFLNIDGDYHKQGGLQIAGTFLSFGLAIGFGLIGGFVTRCFYTQNNKYFYDDTEYFDNAHHRMIYRDDDEGANLYLKQKDGVKPLPENSMAEMFERNQGVEI